MENVEIELVEDPATGTLAEAAYAEPDYRDCLRMKANGQTLEEFAVGFFMSQPRWLAKVSMNLGDRESRDNALADQTFAEGTSVGSWKIHGRTADEILFGEHMGFMEYRLSMLQRADGHFEASTTVKYLKRFAPVYFTIVKPFHRVFVRMAFKNALVYRSDQAAA